MPPIFSSLLFKKTQIQLHSLKTTTLAINVSLFNIIFVHFHRFSPPFNKGMYSSRVKSVAGRPATPRFFSQPCLSFSFFTATNPVLKSTVASPYTFFSHTCMRMGISPFEVKNSITERCLTGLEYMPLLKGGPNRWKSTEILLKSDKLIVNVVVFKLCNYI